MNRRLTQMNTDFLGLKTLRVFCAGVFGLGVFVLGLQVSLYRDYWVVWALFLTASSWRLSGMNFTAVERVFRMLVLTMFLFLVVEIWMSGVSWQLLSSIGLAAAVLGAVHFLQKVTLREAQEEYQFRKSLTNGCL